MRRRRTLYQAHRESPWSGVVLAAGLILIIFAVTIWFPS